MSPVLHYRQFVGHLTLQQQDFSLRGESIERSDMCIIAQNIANAMKVDKAMLLAALYQSFVHKVHSNFTIT